MPKVPVTSSSWVRDNCIWARPGASFLFNIDGNNQAVVTYQGTLSQGNNPWL